MKEIMNEVATIATPIENTNAVEANVAPVVENEASEAQTKRTKDATPLEVIRQLYAADKKAYMREAIKNPYSETSVMKGNFTMKKSEVKAFLPKSASFVCTKKHHFDITFAEGVVFHMHPQGMEFIGTADADDATKKAVLKFAKNFFTESVIETIF